MPASFLPIASGWILSLPHDLKVLFEAKDEPDLDRPLREVSCGAILHILTKDTSGEADFVGYAECAILLREVLRMVKTNGGEGAEDLVARFPELYGELDEELAVCKAAMGESYNFLVGRIDGLPKLQYRNKKVPQYLDDDESAEALYEDGLAFGTNYTIDDEKLGMRLKKTESLLEPFKRRADAERKRRGVA